MFWLVSLMSMCVVGLVALGVYLELHPQPKHLDAPRWFKSILGGNLLLFVLAEAGLLFLGAQDALAQVAAPGGTREVSVGLGLALIGIGIPTALATIGAGIAVGPVGASAMAVILEKPEMFGRSLIFLGLAEGLAIYGLVVTILLLGKI